MRIFRILAGMVVLLAALCAGYLVLRSQGLVGRMRTGDVKEVPPGDQEIALIAPATSDEAWERLVAAANYLAREWPQIGPDAPRLQVLLDHAFLDQTADVPEIGLTFEGHESAILWVRWYKLSSEMDARGWVERLASRDPPPLAVLGGDTSDRAVALGSALRDRAGAWLGKPPLFLISTATADQLHPPESKPRAQLDDKEQRRDAPKIGELYRDRTFRFSFTNSRMAEALMEFLQEHREVWLGVKTDPAYFAGLIGAGAGLGAGGSLAAGGYLQSPTLYTLAWMDDRYSPDLADRLKEAFVETFFRGRREAARLSDSSVAHGVGDFNMVNPLEAHQAGMFLVNSAPFHQPQILALPTGAQKARRFLRYLYNMAPLEIRNLVIVNGDSLTFNQIYRDRDLAWNILDMPVPLVFFSHRTPVAADAGFGERIKVGGEERIASTGTQDLLLYADILGAVIQAAFQQNRLLDDADELQRSLRQTRWHNRRVVNPRVQPLATEGVELFDLAGNRRRFTGEHVIWLRPEYAGNVVQQHASISVWSVRATPAGRRSWFQDGRAFEVEYNSVLLPGNHAHEPD